MILTFKKKADKYYTCFKDKKFYVAGHDIDVIPRLPYWCGGFKKFRTNPKGRSRSGFVVTEAELMYHHVEIVLDGKKIFVYRDKKKVSEIHLERINRSKKNWLSELEKGHKSHKKCAHLFAKYFAISPEEIEQTYDELRECLNYAKKHINNACPYFRARRWGENQELRQSA